MHIQLPKPLHGWRAFAGEVGIIVIGVLIALGAGQVVEDWNWRSKASDAQEALDAELAQTGGIYDVRGMVAPCTGQTLSQVATLIAKARATGRLPLIGRIRGGGTAPVMTSAWDTALNENTVSHIAAERRGRYAALYTAIGIYRDAVTEENRLFSHLRLLENSPGPVSDALLTDITVAAAELKSRVQLNDAIAAQGLVQLRQIGISPKYGLFTGAPGTLGTGTRDEVIQDMKTAGRLPPTCAPVTADGKPVSVEAPPS